MSEESKRVPGEPFRYINAHDLKIQDEQMIKKMEVHNDGEIGIPVRTANAKDAEQIGDKPKPSPLK